MAATLALIGVFLLLYTKVPDVYCLVHYGCTQNEHYKNVLKEEWNITLPASGVLERESVNVGEGSGGIIYTAFEATAGKDISWIPNCTQEKYPDLEVLAESTLNDYFKPAGKNVSVPDFNKEYVWTYLSKIVTDTDDADGLKTAILFYFPEEQKIYFMETAEKGVSVDK